MEDFEPTPEYLQAFNDGYLIAQHLPELSDKLSKIKSISPQIVGMKDGRDQYVHEFEKERYPAWLRSDRFKDKEDVQEKDKEKDGPDLIK